MIGPMKNLKIYISYIYIELLNFFSKLQTIMPIYFLNNYYVILKSKNTIAFIM
jgi:hypothetical protein